MEASGEGLLQTREMGTDGEEEALSSETANCWDEPEAVGYQ